MIKWKMSTKSFLVNGVQTVQPYFEVHDWKGNSSFSFRCTKKSFQTIQKIITDMIYCDDYIEYFPCLEQPTTLDERMLELANLVKEKAIH